MKRCCMLFLICCCQMLSNKLTQKFVSGLWNRDSIRFSSFFSYLPVWQKGFGMSYLTNLSGCWSLASLLPLRWRKFLHVLWLLRSSVWIYRFCHRIKVYLPWQILTQANFAIFITEIYKNLEWQIAQLMLKNGLWNRSWATKNMCE
jgi:hypothetical protein